MRNYGIQGFAAPRRRWLWRTRLFLKWFRLIVAAAIVAILAITYSNWQERRKSQQIAPPEQTVSRHAPIPLNRMA